MIILVVGLIVLIVIVVIFTGKTKLMGDIDACEKQGGQCRESCQSNEFAVPFPCPAEKAEAGLTICCRPQPG
ncbi:MAG: hypothetical protein ACE5DM_00835 [Candidatus Nanoarchaeia archaeon]